MAYQTPPPLYGGPTAQQRYGFSGTAPSRGMAPRPFGMSARRPPTISSPGTRFDPLNDPVTSQDPRRPPILHDFPGGGGTGFPQYPGGNGGIPGTVGGGTGTGIEDQPTWVEGGTINPYSELPDFAGLSIDYPGALMKPPWSTDLQGDRLRNLRAGGVGGIPGIDRVRSMQDALNAVRAMGGVKYGVPGSQRTGTARAAASGATLAGEQRRRAQRQQERRV